MFICVGQTMQFRERIEVCNVSVCGMAVFPGFVNTHNHVGYTFCGCQEDIGLSQWCNQSVLLGGNSRKPQKASCDQVSNLHGDAKERWYGGRS